MRGWRLRIWILCAIALGVGLWFVPLFGVLGFELAIVGAVFGSVAGLDLGAALAREIMWSNAPAIERANYPGRARARGVVQASTLAVGVTALPACVAAIH